MLTAVNEDISQNAKRILRGVKHELSRRSFFPNELASRESEYEAGGCLQSIVSYHLYNAKNMTIPLSS